MGILTSGLDINCIGGREPIYSSDSLTHGLGISSMVAVSVGDPLQFRFIIALTFETES